MSFSSRSNTRTARTAGFGTRGFFGVMRSCQTQTKPFSLLPLRTENPNPFAHCVVDGSEEAMRRTSSWLAMAPLPERGCEDPRDMLGPPLRPVRDLVPAARAVRDDQ